MELLFSILKGAVIGLANVVPGVSGGTMMVSMGVYDTIIWCINNLFKNFVECIRKLLPYAIGMVGAIIIGAFVLKAAFKNFPLPTNTLFIGLILGGVPAILKEMRGTKKGAIGAVLFVALFALVVGLKAIEGNNTAVIELNLFEVLKLVLLGMLASSTMVIPGVSGSMLLKTLGYYEPIVTEAIPGAVSALTSGNWGVLAHNIGILLPFGIGIVLGIFAIARLIDWLMKTCKGWTYMAILGMVVASPVAILMDGANYTNVNVVMIIISTVTFAIGFVAAMKLGSDPEPAAKA